MLQQQTKAATQPRTGSTFCHNLTKAKHGDSSHPFSFWPNGRRLRPPPPPCMVFRVLLRPAALPVFRAACRAVGSSDPETSRNEPSGRPSLVAGGGAGSCVCGGGPCGVVFFCEVRGGTTMWDWGEVSRVLAPKGCIGQRYGEAARWDGSGFTCRSGMGIRRRLVGVFNPLEKY